MTEDGADLKQARSFKEFRKDHGIKDGSPARERQRRTGDFSDNSSPQVTSTEK